MSRAITIIQGHPDGTRVHFNHALADAYARGAEAAGHTVRRLDVAALDFPVLRRREDWEGAPPASIEAAQRAIELADHLVIFYPMWLGSMPALLKAFLEQALRPGFAITHTTGPAGWKKRLGGRSARVVVTMGMPAAVYKWYFRAHSLKSLERNVLKFCGIAPIRESLIGMVESPDGKRRAKWLTRMEALGREGR